MTGGRERNVADEGQPAAGDGPSDVARGLAWVDAACGMPAGWPPCLTAAVEFVRAIALPAAVVWSGGHVAVANAALARTPGARGPAWPGGVLRAAAAGVARPSPPGDWAFTPLRDEAGRVAGLLAVADAQPVAADLAELQHQARNAIAWVRSIAKRTAATSPDLDDYVMHLDGRIDAVARARAAAALRPAGVDLAELVAAELLALAVQDVDAVSIGGPDVLIAPRSAETVALALHELATNAVKFGALSVPDGRIAVSWTVGPDGAVVEWREAGVPGPLALSRSGFGMEVLERTLPYEVGATTNFRFATDGACCTLVLPRNAVALA